MEEPHSLEDSVLEGPATTAAPTSPTWTRGWRLAFAVTILAALALRALYLSEYSASPLFTAPIGPDVAEYYNSAERVLAGHWLWEHDIAHGQLYGYLLALWLWITQHSLPAVRALQLLTGVAAIILLALAVGRRFGPAPAVCTAALWAIYIPTIYYEAELFAEGTGLLLDAAVLALLIARPGVGPGRALLTGLLLGLTVLTHASAMIFSALVLAWMALGGEPTTWMRRARNVALAALGFVVTVGPVVAYNSAEAGEFMLTQDTGGLNFYIGNGPAADGTPNLRPGPEWDNLVALSSAEGVSREYDLHSAFYYQRVLEHARAAPGRWALLLLKKAGLSLSAHEITASAPIATIADVVTLLKWPWLGFGVLLPLALIGLLCARGYRLPSVWLLIVAYSLSQTIYVAAGRYRVPMLPALFVLGGLGLAHWLAALRKGAWPDAGRSAALAILGIAVACLPLVPVQDNDAVEGHMGRAMAYAFHEHWPSAVTELQAVLALRPDSAPAFMCLGDMLLRLKQPDEALDQYRAAVAAEPDYAAAQRTLAEALVRQLGDLDAAKPHYLRAIEIDPADCDTHYLYGRTLLVWEQWAAAAEQFQFVLTHRRSIDAQAGLGEALLHLRRYAEALPHLEAAVVARPDNVRVLTALARLRAACPDEALRDPATAVRYGQRAVGLSQFADSSALDALAMALAAVGRYEDATDAAAGAAQVAQREHNGAFRAEILSRRALYLRRTPYRDPPPVRNEG